jgi:hypothetical protein
VVLPASRRVPRAPRYSGHCPTKPTRMPCTGLSPSPVALPRKRSTTRRVSQLRGSPCRDPRQALQPPPHNAARLSRVMSLGSSPFARRYLGNHGCFLLLQVLRWFSSPGLPSVTYVFSNGCRASSPTGYPIRPSADLGMCAPPRGFSQLTTAFFVQRLLGIHHGPFFA